MLGKIAVVISAAITNPVTRSVVGCSRSIEELKARCDALYNKVKKQAAVLTKARTAAAREVEKQDVYKRQP